MKVLVSQISWHTFYRGEDETFPCSYIENQKDSTNFVNLNGFYFGYFNGKGLTLEHHQEKMRIDYLIFVSNHPTKGQVICGWYKNATIFIDEQQHQKGNYYYAIGKDEDCVLLDEKDRDFSLSINYPFEWVELNRRLKVYLEKTNKRVNYRHSDINKTAQISLTDLKTTCELIETSIMHAQYLLALQMTNKAITVYGKIASLIYYKAWILYLLLQYPQAIQLLAQIMNVEAYSELVNYMLGNIFFEVEEYEKSIQYLKKVKTTNLDMTNYMLAQAYAMLGQVAFAKGAIEKALIVRPNEPAYLSFKQSLKEWNHEQ